VTDPMAGWHEQAGVRRQPRRLLAEDRELGLVLFPEKEIPYLGHEAVAALPTGARDALVARHLYQYLLYTVHLETKVVNRGVAMMAHDEVGYPMAPAIRLDALKVYCDEGYHALYNLDIIQQVASATGTPVLPYDFQPRLDRLDRTADRFLPDQPRLAHLLQVVIFETMVTSILADVPHDPTVHRVIRAVVGDHARDETYHHALFVKVFRELWVQLPAALRTAVAQAIPHLIDDCLRPDLAVFGAALRSAGLAAPLVDEILAESYSEEAVRAAIREASRHTVRLCRSVGAFDLPGAADHLAELGLDR
jgi:hypothetical protein